MTLFFLSMLLALGISATRIALLNSKAAYSATYYAIAFQAAEAAVKDAEDDIERGSRSTLFASTAPPLFKPGECQSDGSARGLCESLPNQNIWQNVSLESETQQSLSVPYGLFTAKQFYSESGAAYSAVSSSSPSSSVPGQSTPPKTPRYIIERLPERQAGYNAAESSASDFQTSLYRITAVGFYGQSSQSAGSYIQTIYRKVEEK